MLRCYEFTSYATLDFLFIVEILYGVQKGSGSTLISMSCQTLAASLEIMDLLELCTNIWCNNFREILLLGMVVFDFDFCFVFTKHACFLCTLCGNVAAFCWSALKKPMKILHGRDRYVPNSST